MIYTDRATWSAGELLTLPEDGYHYELVKGRLVQMSPTTAEHGESSNDIGAELALYAREHGGHAYAAETGFNLTRPGEAEETVLGPDAAYIRDAVVPRDRHGFVGRAPDLAVEVASPSQFRPELEGKVRLWLARGCQLVWLVWPIYQTIEVWRAGDAIPRHILRPGDELDGGEVLPGFRCPVAGIFHP